MRARRCPNGDAACRSQRANTRTPRTGAKTKDGGYEWDRGTSAIEKRKFTSAGGAAELRTTDGIATDCSSETTIGELSGSKSVANVEVTFQGCRANLGNLVCTGGELEEEQLEEGYLKEKPGEIKTRTLTGKLGYIEGKGSANPGSASR